MDDELIAMIVQQFFAENFPTEREIPVRPASFGGDQNQSILFQLINALAGKQVGTTRESGPEPMFSPESQEMIQGIARLFGREAPIGDVRDFEEQPDATMVAESMFLERIAIDQFLSMMSRPGG